MITPGERFNAFSRNRLIKKDHGATFEIGRKLTIPPTKHAIFTAFHLLNRSITNIPWLFWLSLVIAFVQLACSALSPFHTAFWERFPELNSFINVIQIILRYIPYNQSEIVMDIVFGVYCFIGVLHFIEFVIIVELLLHKKDSTLWIKIFFFHSYLVFPILRSSMSFVFAYEFALFTRETTLGNFFLSLISLIMMVGVIGMDVLTTFAMASSPNPNLLNPLAIWAPCAWRAVLYEIVSVANFILQELTRRMDWVGIAVANIIIGLAHIPAAIYLSIAIYYISYTAYEYIGMILYSLVFFHCFLGVFSFIDGIPSWVYVLVWVLTPGVVFTIMRAVNRSRIKRFLKKLNQCGTPTQQINDEIDEMGEPIVTSVFDSLELKSARQAIFAIRAACIANHPAFGDLSFLKYCIEVFPSANFFFLHLAFLVENQTIYVQQLIDQFLTNYKPKILEEAVLFQMVTSMQESSNDLTQSIVREISRQTLQAMKCTQLLSKFWTSCYKGDITQMSRHAFTLNKHITNLNNHWKMLVLRYPFSVPVLKEYVKFLSTTGCQHRTVEAILVNHPHLMDMTSTNNDQDINFSLLHQSVEEAVDRRPIHSESKLNTSLGISIFLAISFLIAVVALSCVYVRIYKDFLNYQYQSQYYGTQLAVVPTFDDSLLADPSLTRNDLYEKSANLENSLNMMFQNMPADVMNQTSKEECKMKLDIDDYHDFLNVDFVTIFRLTSYYSHSLSFIPPSQLDMRNLLVNNIIAAVNVLNTTNTNALNDFEKDLNLLLQLSPIFYGASWVILILVMTPIVVYAINQLKDELTYLFAIYLTIPRSFISKFIDSGGGGKQDGKKNYALLMTSTSFGHHTTTTKDFTQDDDDKQGPANIADNYKMLVNDSSVNISVLPKGFIPKAIGIFGFVCIFFSILTTVVTRLFMDDSNEFIKACHTLKVASSRSIAASIIMHGITAQGLDYKIPEIELMLTNIAEFHSALLYSSSEFRVSEKLLNDPVIQAIQFNDQCSDQAAMSCRSLVVMLDYFIKTATNVTKALKINGPTPGADPHADLRNLFNNNITPLLEELLLYLKAITDKNLQENENTYLIIFFVGIGVFLIVVILFVRPVIIEVVQTIGSVKLPLKYIYPIDIVDLPKVLQYLQGESDFRRGNDRDKGIENHGGNSILNAMLCPFAIFESDLSLLFANNAFYTLMGSSREASVGLPLSDIFSSVMSFKSNESHPFNSLLETVTQLQRGVSPVNIVEIRTELELSNQPPSPVMIRLVGITADEKEQAGDTNNQQIKASSYAIYINDLSSKRSLEEKLKYENDLSKKLVDSAVPRSLATVLKKGDTYAPAKLEDIPMLIFSIKFNTNDEEFDDELMVACSLFMRTSSDINNNFSSVSKLIHQPPLWVYIAGLEEDRDLVYSTNELTQFALSINEVFSASSTTNYNLTAVIHIGEITILPLQLDLPIIEAIGSGYNELGSAIHAVSRGKVYVTEVTKQTLISQKTLGFLPTNDSYEDAKETGIVLHPLYEIIREFDPMDDANNRM